MGIQRARVKQFLPKHGRYISAPDTEHTAAEGGLPPGVDGRSRRQGRGLFLALASPGGSASFAI